MRNFFGLVFIALIVAPIAMLGAYALTPWEPVRGEAATIFGFILFGMGYGGLTFSALLNE